MKVNILKQTKNEVKIEIAGEGHSFCNALQKMLLEDEDVSFAGYNISHPLVAQPIVYVRTKRGKEAKAALVKAAKALGKRMDTFQKAFEEASKEAR